MATKSWGQLTKSQKEDVRKRLTSPYRAFDGNPYIYYVENGRVAKRRLKYSLEEMKERRRLQRNVRLLKY